MNGSVIMSEVVQRFGSTVALDSVSLRLSPGITGLLGPNGAGKTTLLRILATVQEPTSGQVGLLGLDARSERERRAIRRRLGYVPQELGFPRGFTAFAFVEYMAVLKEWVDPKTRRAEVRRVLELVGLDSLSTKSVRKLSGGMRRRLGLAQALLGQPDLLLLDEPTTGLDPEQRAAFRALMLEVGRDATLVVATHLTEDVAAVCERVVVMDEGSVTFDGSVSDFVARAHDHVWVADSPDGSALAHRRTASGRYRHVGDPPTGAEFAQPDVEDAYLLLRGTREEAMQ
jgi:ABC-2 type transport system ATP-binding protein